MSQHPAFQPPRDAPHIRLNSGQDNILASPASNNRPLGPSRPPSSRSLVPQRPPTAPSLRSNPSANRLYSNGPQESAETLLIPPPRSRTHRFRDEDSVPGTPVEALSRRTSFSSDGREDRAFVSNPFEDSSAPSRAGSDDDNVNTQTVSEKYNILPSAGLLLFPEDIEKDDWLHNPDPNEKERDCDIWTKRGFVNVGGLALITVGILVLFIGYPILYGCPGNAPRPPHTDYIQDLRTRRAASRRSLQNQSKLHCFRREGALAQEHTEGLD